MTIFISGPMHGLPDFNYPMFHKAGDYLKAQGKQFLSPAHGRFGHPRTPPAQGHRPLAHDIRHTLKQLLLCDSILMLPNWRDEDDSWLQRDLANNLNMPIEYWKPQS